MASGLGFPGERRQVSVPGTSTSGSVLAISVLQHGFGGIGAPAALDTSPGVESDDQLSPMSTGEYADARRAAAEVASLVVDSDERLERGKKTSSSSSLPMLGLSRSEDWLVSSKAGKDTVWGGSSLFTETFPTPDLGFSSLGVPVSSPPVSWGKIRSAPLFEEPKVLPLDRFAAVGSPRHSRSKTSDFGLLRGLERDFYKAPLERVVSDPSSDYSAGSGDEESVHQLRADGAIDRLYMSSSARETMSSLSTDDATVYSMPGRLERPESAPAERSKASGYPRSKSSLASRGLAIGAKEFIPSMMADDSAGAEKRIKFGEYPDKDSVTSESISSSKHSRVSFGSASQIESISSAKRKRPTRLSGDLKDVEMDSKPRSALAGHRRSVSDRTALKFAASEFANADFSLLSSEPAVVPKDSVPKPAAPKVPAPKVTAPPPIGGPVLVPSRSAPVAGPVLGPSRSRERKGPKTKKPKASDSEKHHRAKSTGSYLAAGGESAPLKISITTDTSTGAGVGEDGEQSRRPPSVLRPKSMDERKSPTDSRSKPSEEKKSVTTDHRRAKSDGVPLKEVMDPLDYMNSDVHVPKHVLLFKTELCRAYLKTGFCKYGDSCHFAHGIAEVRSARRHPKFKTEKCKMYHEKGSCPFGDTCAFIHEEAGPTLETIRNDIAAELSKTFAGDQVVDVEVEVKKPLAASPIGPKKI